MGGANFSAPTADNAPPPAIAVADENNAVFIMNSRRVSPPDSVTFFIKLRVLHSPRARRWKDNSLTLRDCGNLHIATARGILSDTERGTSPARAPVAASKCAPGHTFLLRIARGPATTPDANETNTSSDPFSPRNSGDGGRTARTSGRHCGPRLRSPWLDWHAGGCRR